MHAHHSRTQTVTARDWFAFNQMSRREQDAWLHEQQLMAAPPPIEPEFIEDFTPTGVDLDQNAGPCLVDISCDTSSDAEYGHAGRIECWTVEAGVNSPSYRLVAS